jgi:beta-phosphoglucomutase-like phosphatase (HAD superfamily)
VARGKPHPEPYLTAARELDVLAGECLAIEDSDTGATSAAAAGCTVLCAPLHVTVPPGPRRVFTDSLVGLSAESLLPV